MNDIDYIDYIGRLGDEQLARDIARYTDDATDWRRLEEEARERNAEALAEKRAECLASDELLGDALMDWLAGETQQHARLAHAIRAATGADGASPRRQYIEEIADEAAGAWAHDYTEWVTADDLAERERDAKDDFYEDYA